MLFIECYLRYSPNLTTLFYWTLRQTKTDTIMYIEKSEFTLWMEKLSEKLDKIGKSLKELCNSSEVMKDDKLLDNQDLAF